MKRVYIGSLFSLFLTQSAFAIVPVTLSNPSPAIASSYNTGSSNTITYTITNNVPNLSFPISVGGISNPITRTTVSNDCGNALPAGPSTCNIGIVIAPTSANAGASVNQQLSINYQGRKPLTSPVVFSVPGAPTTTVTATLSDTLVATGDLFNILYAQSGSGSNTLSATLPGSMSFASGNNCSVNQASPNCSLSVNSGSTLGTFTITPTLVSGNATIVSSPDPLTITVGTRYSYVTDDSNIYQCTLNTNGSFNACTVTPSGGVPSRPYSIEFTTVNGTRYGYVGSATPGGRPSQCTLNSNGTFNTCTATPSSGAPSWKPLRIRFATVNGTQYSYVADENGNIYQCTINTNGSLNTCTVTPSSGAPAWNPVGLTFATFNGTQYGYVSDVNGSVFQCTINTNGSFNTCSATPSSGAPSWTPFGVTFTTVNGTRYGYVADASGLVFQCTLNSNGTLNICTITPSSGAPAWSPLGVTFATINGTQYSYVPSDSSTVFQCTLNANGSFNVCTTTPSSGAPSWSTPTDIAFAIF